MARASDGAGPRRSGTETCSRPAKATRWVAYCGTTWRTCRHRRAGHEIAAAPTSSTHKAWLLLYHQNGRRLLRARSDTAGVNQSLI